MALPFAYLIQVLFKVPAQGRIHESPAFSYSILILGSLFHLFVFTMGLSVGLACTIRRRYVSASLPGKPWALSMWPRDGGAFLREMIAWGDLLTASTNANAVMALSKVNRVLVQATRHILSPTEYMNYFVPARGQTRTIASDRLWVAIE